MQRLAAARQRSYQAAPERSRMSRAVRRTGASRELVGVQVVVVLLGLLAFDVGLSWITARSLAEEAGEPHSLGAQREDQRRHAVDEETDAGSRGVRLVERQGLRLPTEQAGD